MEYLLLKYLYCRIIKHFSTRQNSISNFFEKKIKCMGFHSVVFGFLIMETRRHTNNFNSKIRSCRLQYASSDDGDALLSKLGINSSYFIMGKRHNGSLYECNMRVWLQSVSKGIELISQYFVIVTPYARFECTSSMHLNFILT